MFLPKIFGFCRIFGNFRPKYSVSAEYSAIFGRIFGYFRPKIFGFCRNYRIFCFGRISVSAETDCFCRKYSVSAEYSAILTEIFGFCRIFGNFRPNIRLFSAENFRFLPKLQNILFRPNFGFGSVSVIFLKQCFCFCRNCEISFGRTLVPRYKPGSLTDGFTPILSVEV